MEAYEGIMNSTRAPFSILPKPIDEDGNTVTTVAQFGLSSLCMRTPMAQAPDEWLTALQR